MNNLIVMQSVIAVVIGVLILIMPRILNYAVAVYLIIVGALGLISFYA